MADWSELPDGVLGEIVTSMVDWSELPNDVLGEIVLKLDNPIDVVYFSGVCHSWYDAYSIIKKKWTVRMPWLMLSETDKENPNHLRKIYCPMREKTLGLKIPETFGARCWGSSCGWVVTFDLNQELHLFNPITRARLPLPPKSTLTQENYGGVDDPEWIRRFFINKVVVFTDDGSGNDDLIVIAIYCLYFGYLAYARPGDKTWTPLITSEINKHKYNETKARALDVVRWGSQLLIMFYNGVLGYCDMSALGDSQPVKVMEYLPPPLDTLDLLFKGKHMIYLLESFGNIFVVLRYKESCGRQSGIESIYETIFFDVYKINLDAKRWEEVEEDLGDVALFVGNNSSMSVGASGANNCKRNNIYFNDDEREFWEKPLLCGEYDIGRYDMETVKISPVYSGDGIHSSFCPPFWFMPKFF